MKFWLFSNIAVLAVAGITSFIAGRSGLSALAGGGIAADNTSACPTCGDCDCCGDDCCDCCGEGCCDETGKAA